MNKLELGQKIRALRKERKQTLETLAEAADIGLVYLGEIERGIKMPSLKTFIKLVNALDVSADELIGLETKSGRDYYTQKLSEQLQSLTQEEAAAVLSILETTIQQVKNLRNETVCLNKSDRFFVTNFVVCAILELCY